MDAIGIAYVAGGTGSINFPVTPGAYDTIHFISEAGDGFLTKINSAGSGLVYSTFLSGGSDGATAIAVDEAGNAYVAGAASSGFDTTQDAFDKTHNNSADAFFMKLNVAGSALVYSTYLGGTSSDIAWGMALDGPGNAYVIGQTYSSDFPTTPGALNRRNRTDDGFVTKFAEV